MKVKGAFSGPLRSWQSLGVFFVKSQLPDFFGSPGQNSGHWYFLRLHPHHQCRTLALVGSRLHSWTLGNGLILVDYQRWCRSELQSTSDTQMMGPHKLLLGPWLDDIKWCWGRTPTTCYPDIFPAEARSNACYPCLFPRRYWHSTHCTVINVGHQVLASEVLLIELYCVIKAGRG